MSEERTTQREIAQDKMNGEIMLALGRLEGKMDGVLNGQEALFKITNDHDTRISHTEDALYGIKIKIGIIGAVIGATASALIDWIWQKFTSHS